MDGLAEELASAVEGWIADIAGTERVVVVAGAGTHRVGETNLGISAAGADDAFGLEAAAGTVGEATAIVGTAGMSVAAAQPAQVSRDYVGRNTHSAQNQRDACMEMASAAPGYPAQLTMRSDHQIVTCEQGVLASFLQMNSVVGQTLEGDSMQLEQGMTRMRTTVVVLMKAPGVYVQKKMIAQKVSAVE